ncbi:hypothetical protein DES54_15619 [Brenneria salicis ATCC 15712 = DSM 30166]|uniref:Uncharacterized protein n=1 Tax=Brenneria salicis ATCC 15712 = DSM 30166 TaxID=714314 RepID=A0A366HWW8_9GAMM|nr:hypothetical protein DES54_15619 [Brenneria salicis ATCC 15712 = DSM 30166]
METEEINKKPEAIPKILPAFYYPLLSGGNLPPVLHPCHIQPIRKAVQPVSGGAFIER